MYQTSGIKNRNITKIVKVQQQTMLIAFFFFSLLQSGDDLFRVSTTLVLAESLFQENFSPDWKNDFHSNTNTKQEQKANLRGKLETKKSFQKSSLYRQSSIKKH